MVFTRALLPLVIGFSFTQASAWGAPQPEVTSLRLTAEADGQRHEHFAIAHGRIVMREAGKDLPVPGSVVWKLEGDLGRDDALPAFSPWFRIWQQPPLIADGPRRYSAVVRVERAWPWSLSELGNGILVLAWVVEGKALQVTPIIPDVDVRSSRREAAIHAFDLGSENVRGVPIVLLLGPHGFVRSAPRFSDRATQKVLADLNLRSPEAALESARQLKSIEPDGPKTPTILHSAAAAGRVELVNYLLSRGADPDLESKQSTPFRLAAADGRDAVIRAMLDAKSSGASSAAVTKAVTAAADFGHLDTAMTLLHACAASPALIGRVATLAIQQDRADVLAALLAQSRDVDLAAISPPAIGQALLRQDHEILGLLLRGGMNPDTKVEGIPWLILSTYARDTEAVAALLRARVTVDAADPTGVTPLMIAARGGRRELLGMLLVAGADPNHRDSRGTTPLHLSAAAGRADLMKDLLAGGARVDFRDDAGRSALDLALVAQSRPAISLLVEAGAKLAPQDPSFGSMVIQAILLDQSGLLRGATAAGWDPGWPVFESLTASELAEAADAKSTIDWLRTLSLPAPTAVAWTIERNPDSPARPVDGGRPADPRPREEDQPAVTITMTGAVDTRGRLLFPRIGSCPDARLAQAALAAVPTWKFTPAMRKGRAVNSLVTLSMSFGANEAKVHDLADVDVPPAVAHQAGLRSKEVVDVGYAVKGGVGTAFAASRPPAFASVPPAFASASMVYTIGAEYGDWTVLAFVVEPDGRPSNIAVVSAKDRDFARSAAKALGNYSFYPGLLAGHPVRTHLTMTLQPDN